MGSQTAAGPLDLRHTAVQVIGAINGSGRITVRDTGAAPDAPMAVDLDLEHVLGDMPDKTYSFDRRARRDVAPQHRCCVLHMRWLAGLRCKACCLLVIAPLALPAVSHCPRLRRHQRQTQPLSIPPGTSVEAALKLVLQLPAVGSKRFLTTKVDRCVTGVACIPVWACM